jgi:hypothetical protein
MHFFLPHELQAQVICGIVLEPLALGFPMTSKVGGSSTFGEASATSPQEQERPPDKQAAYILNY